MEKTFYSIKQIADKLGTTKQRVYRCIKKHCINESHTDMVNGNTVLMYDDDAFARISELIGDTSTASNKTHETHQETPNETLYEALLKQLEIKDKQIEQLQKALDQAQKLNAMDKQKILELEDKMAAVDQEPVKKKWWQIFFSKG